MNVQFGLVKQIQWVAPDGKPLPLSPQHCNYAQGLTNQGSQSTPRYSVFARGGESCGDPHTQHFLVYNGPTDTDGDTFNHEAVAINERYMPKLPLSDADREQLIIDKRTLFDQYHAHASGTIPVTVLSNDRFEFAR